jgi:hypothetical protein
MKNVKSEIYKEFDKHSTSFTSEKMISLAMNKFGMAESTARKVYYEWKKEFMTSKQPIEEPVGTSINEIFKTPELIAETKTEYQDEPFKILYKKTVNMIKVVGKYGEYCGNTLDGIVITTKDSKIKFNNVVELDEFYRETIKAFKMISM